MLKKLKSVKFLLFIGLLISIAIAGYSSYYKMTNWGFSIAPKQTTRTWNIEANINFIPTGTPIKILIATPKNNSEYTILDDSIIAPDYAIKKKKHTIELKSSGKTEKQNMYYRVLLLKNQTDEQTKNSNFEEPKKVKKPKYDEHKMALAKNIIELAKNNEGKEDFPQKLIAVLHQNPKPTSVASFIPFKISNLEMAKTIKELLALEGIYSRYLKGIYLSESKKLSNPEFMIEAYTNNEWKMYNIQTSSVSKYKNFITLSQDDEPLIQIEGGEESSIQYSVLKSSTSNISLANQRARINNSQKWFEMSAFSLPINQQNTIKWLSAYPLAILIIVILRNMVGLSTMGTFTPMLIAMSLTQTGFLVGMSAFILLISLGMLIRTTLSKLNLLLVPRISAIVICVIIIMHAMTIIGYQMKFEIASSTIFFPIIIIGWIIERASITWEEDGALNASREIIFSLITATLTYFIINNETIKHITFAFSEINLVILFLVMLIGTYTGYRLNELKRFAPLVKRK